MCLRGPGYVGYTSGGVLQRQLRCTPPAVVYASESRCGFCGSVCSLPASCCAKFFASARSPSVSAVGNAPDKRSGCKQTLIPQGCCCCPHVFFCLCLPRSGHRADPGLSGLLLATCVGVFSLCVAVLSTRSFCGICSRGFRRKLHTSLWVAHLWRLEHSRCLPIHARFQRFVTFGQVGFPWWSRWMLFNSHL